jgi:dockerin type I repeat protein
MKKKSASQSAFFNPRTLIGFGFCLLGLLLALLAYTAYPGASLMAQKPSQQTAQQWQPRWVVVASSHNDVSAPLREMATWPLPPFEREHEAAENPKIGIVRAGGNRPDPVVQRKFLSRLTTNIPGPILNFDGIPFPGVVCNCAPPDTQGYVGLTQYVQIVNEAYQVFNKFTGASVLGPVAIHNIWSGFGGVCQNGSGDPVVLYDKLADRWLISQFAVAGSVPNHQCIAISTTRDATGSYYRYDFDLTAYGSNFYDYPKLSTWPDAYYMAMNVFNSSGTAYLGTEPFAFNRTKMLCGLPATVISPGVVGTPANNEDPVMPADIDGPVLPPPGAPNTFVEFPDITGNNLNSYRTWHYHVDFAVPTNSTFTQFAGPAAAPFTFLCPGTRSCVPELGVLAGNWLDGLADRLMFRLAYRNFGTPSAPNESVVANYSVFSGGVAGVRWFELKNVTNGPETVNQESTYQPDTTWRWLGSVAMDHSGDLAVGFSASSPTIVPGVRYAGRFSTDPPSTLAQGEAVLFAGVGAQTDTGNRWGDYSCMTVDPVDDTTMWYTNEYYPNGITAFNWRTRIGTFRINANQPLVNVSAKSEVIHGGAGPFDIDLPLYAGATGPGRGVECRNGSGGSYTIIFNFTNSVTAVGGVTSTCGTPTAAIGADNHQVLVSLAAGDCNAQYITVTLNNVSDGTNTISAPVTFGLLIGDTNGNGTVNSSDVAMTKAQSGAAACPPNFRTDVNGDGNINSSDVALVKFNVGNSLPTPP